jgi:hypothetical protein
MRDASSMNAAQLPQILPLAVLAVFACGPSLQVGYEGESRFEHCYALDAKKEVLDQRDACWRNWETRYGARSSRDRLRYAQARLREIELGMEASKPKP